MQAPSPSIRADCPSCDQALPLKFLQTALTPDSPSSQHNLLATAFSPTSAGSPSDGLAAALQTTQLRRDRPSNDQLIDVAYGGSSRYYRQPNCFVVAISNGMRGIAVGSVFGGAMGLSTAVQSGYRGTAAATVAGQGALRNAVAFGSWTAVYGFSRCALIRARGRDDMLNAAVAGGFTGGALTLISLRGHWRYNQSAILTNAGGSAMVAVMFHALNQM